MNKDYKFIFAISEQKIKILIFSIGLFLTTWESFNCLQKYLHSNLSVKMTMARSNETIFPSLTICPEYFWAYNLTNLNRIGIEKANDYRNGDWYGNSTLDGRIIFESVTHNFSDLVESFRMRYKSGEKRDFSGSFEDLNMTVKGHTTFGRCFEIHIMTESDRLDAVDITFSKSIYIYFIVPHQFYNDDSKSKLHAIVGQSLFIDITYEFMKENFGKTCKFYLSETYDTCKSKEIEKKIFNKYNCTFPFLTTSSAKLCPKEGFQEISKEASKDFYKLFDSEFVKCPSPCINMRTFVGYPSLNSIDGNKGFVRIYFKSIIKTTEDFMSYDLLR